VVAVVANGAGEAAQPTIRPVREVLASARFRGAGIDEEADGISPASLLSAELLQGSVGEDGAVGEEPHGGRAAPAQVGAVVRLVGRAEVPAEDEATVEGTAWARDR
jgi:hypothetical protein